MGSIRAYKAIGKMAIVSMPMPLTFKTVRRWQAYFQGHGLTLLSTEVRHNAVKPMSKVTFVIEV